MTAEQGFKVEWLALGGFCAVLLAEFVIPREWRHLWPRLYWVGGAFIVFSAGLMSFRHFVAGVERSDSAGLLRALILFILALAAACLLLYRFALMESGERGRNVELHRAKERLAVTVCDLSGSTFDDVNLSGATFHNVNLSGASVNDANLSGWRIENANVSGLRLSNANLAGATISGCRLDGMTIDGVEVSALLAAWKATQAA